MTRDEIGTAVLTTDADTSHEDARDWYGSYGWHLTTENAGDVTLDAVEYDWLDMTDERAAEELRAVYADLTSDEALSIVTAARSVREAAESICGALDTAVSAYERRDLAGVRAALLAAWSQESDHGDTPATSTLAGQLLESLVEIGEWGYGDIRGAGNWFAPKSKVDAVRAAYDAIEDGDLGPDVDRDIIAAGGVFVRD